MLRRVFPRLLPLAVWALLWIPSGCAHGPLRDDSLVLEIAPQPLKRGERALATLNAPLDAVEVIGKVRVMGSPEAVFVKSTKRKNWYFSGVIPFSPWVGPGQYTLRAIVTLPEGRQVYTEIMVDLQ
jgi:hypothetical protein